MAIINTKLIKYATQARFDIDIAKVPAVIDSKSIVFVEDTGRIYAHGKYFGGAWKDITDKPDTYTPSAHKHGPITNDGKIGTSANRIIETTTGGLLTHVAKKTAYNKAFGTGADQVARGNHTHAYLPLTGGTITGTSYNMLTLARSNVNGSSILFKNSAGNLGKLGFASNGVFHLGNGASTDGVGNLLQITSTGVAQFYGNISTSGLITGTGFSKTGATDAHMLLGSGGHKAISDFVPKQWTGAGDGAEIWMKSDVTTAGHSLGLHFTNSTNSTTATYQSRIQSRRGSGNYSDLIFAIRDTDIMLEILGQDRRVNVLNQLTVQNNEVYHTGNLNLTTLDGVPTSRTLTAGNGLTGGGDLTANRTITLGTPSAITALSSNSVSTQTHSHLLQSSTVNLNTGLNTDIDGFVSGSTGSPRSGSVMGTWSTLRSSTSYGAGFFARANQAWFRTRENGVMQGWNELYHTGNIPTWNQDTSGTAANSTTWNNQSFVTGTQTSQPDFLMGKVGNAWKAIGKDVFSLGTHSHNYESLTGGRWLKKGDSVEVHLGYRLGTSNNHRHEIIIPWAKESGSLILDVEILIATSSVGTRGYTKRRFYLAAYASGGAGVLYSQDSYIAERWGGSSYNHIGTFRDDPVNGNIVLDFITAHNRGVNIKLKAWGYRPLIDQILGASVNMNIEEVTRPGIQNTQTPIGSTFEVTNDLIVRGTITGNASSATNLSRSILAGNGLSGGGVLNADRTLTLGTPSTLTATSTNTVGTTNHSHAITTTTTGLKNTIVQTDSSGDITARHFRSTAGNSTTISGAMAYRISDSDNYIRFCSSTSAIKTWLGLNNVGNDDFKNYGLGSDTSVNKNPDDFGSMSSGFYGVSTGAVGNPVTGASGTLIHLRSPASGNKYWAQLHLLANGATSPRAFISHGQTTRAAGWEELYHTGNFANGTTSQYIRGDGSLATYSDTKYSALTAAEASTGTATTARTISAKVLADEINRRGDLRYLSLTGGILTGDIQYGTDTGTGSYFFGTTSSTNGYGSWMTQNIKEVNGVLVKPRGTLASKALTINHHKGMSLFVDNRTGLAHGVTAELSQVFNVSTAGVVTAASFSGNINASSLNTGTVPNARITGTYTGLTNLTGTGNVDFARFIGNAGDTVAAPSITWSADLNTGIYRPGADQVAITTGGVQRALFNSAGITGTLIGNASTATKLASITTTFTGTYPVTFNVNGNIYSHTGITYTGSTGELKASKFVGGLSGNADSASYVKSSGTIKTDYNNYRTEGIYTIFANASQAVILNRPSNSAGVLEVTASTSTGTSGWVFQRFHDYSDDSLYTRRRYTTGWSTWRKSYHTGNIPTWNQSTTGNAKTASAVSTSAENSSTASRYILFANSANGNQALKTDSGLKYVPSTNTITATLAGNASSATTAGSTLDWSGQTYNTTVLTNPLYILGTRGTQWQRVDLSNFSLSGHTHTLSQVLSAGNDAANKIIISGGNTSHYFERNFKFNDTSGGWARTGFKMHTEYSVENPFNIGMLGSGSSYSYTYLGFEGYNSSNNLRIYPSGTVSATTFSGNLTGNVTGNVSGSAGSTANWAGNTYTNSNITNEVYLMTSTNGTSWRRTLANRFSESGHTHPYLPLSTSRISTSINDIKSSGFYSLGNALDRPTGSYSYSPLIVAQSSSDRFVQLYLDSWGGSDNIYYRNGNGSVWGSWNTIYHSGNFANGTTNQYIRGDGSLATYSDTTYSEITEAQTVSTSSSAVRLITGRRLKYAFDNITAANATNATNTTNINTLADNSSNAARFILFSDAATGNQRAKTDTGLKYNPSSNTITATLAGNASTATKLANINTTFTGKYPVTVNVNGTIYSHTGITFTGSTGTLSATNFSGNLTGTASGNIPYSGANKPIDTNNQTLIIGGELRKLASIFEWNQLTGSTFNKYTDVVSYGLGNVSETRDIIITIPVTTTTVWHAEIDFFRETQYYKLRVGAYNTSNTSRYVITEGNSPIEQVKFCRYNGYTVIIVKDISVRRLQVNLTNVWRHHTNGAAFNNKNNYNIEFDYEANLSGLEVTATINKNNFTSSRTINGTLFDGTANIITANWGTARNIGVVNSDGTGTAVVTSVNGSKNVNLRLPATIKASLTGNASSATKLGTTTIGGTVKPFYLNAGTPTAFSTTVGSTSKGVYMNAGSITAMSATVGSSTAPVYMKSGTITACGTSLGVSITGNASSASRLESLGDKRHSFSPSDVMSRSLVTAFSTQGALANQTNNSDYSDVIAINSYLDTSAGGVNALSFDKNSFRINHFFGYYGDSFWEGFKTLAYLTDNVASATKLKNSRTIWGQSFDGTGNISGALSADRIVVTSTSNVKHLEFSRSDYNYITSKGHIGFITGGTGTSSANQQVWIHSNGNTKIGAGSSSVPAYTLDVNGTGSFTGNLRAAEMSAQAFFQDSDIRLKNVIEPLKINIKDILNIPSFYFTYKDKDKERINIGTSAQEVQKVFPEIVNTNSKGMLSVEYDKFGLIALELIKTQQKEIDSLKYELNNLKLKIDGYRN